MYICIHVYICIHIYTHCVYIYIYVITLDYLVLHTPLELKKQNNIRH